MKKVFITGGSGLIGQYLNLELSQNFEILTQYNSNIGNCILFNSIKLDLTNFIALNDVLKNFKPDFIIHTAAISNPNEAENLGKEKVNPINVEPTKFLAEYCEHNNCRLVFFSTDLVYDGNSSDLKKETDLLNPISVYANSKVEAEKIIQDTFDNYLILRIALHYGIPFHHSQNHFSEILNKLKNGEEVFLFNDQFRTPLELTQSAKMLNELLIKDISGEIINWGGREKLSRYELGIIAAEVFNLDKNLIHANSMKNVASQIAVKDVSMNTDKLRELGVKQKSAYESLSFLFT